MPHDDGALDAAPRGRALLSLAAARSWALAGAEALGAALVPPTGGAASADSSEGASSRARFELDQLVAGEVARLVVRVDGPYGTPIVPDNYDELVMVAGGIGVTPCVSILRSLHTRLAAAGGAASAVPSGVTSTMA